MKKLLIFAILLMPSVAMADGYFGCDSALAALQAADSANAIANIDTADVSGTYSVQIFKATGNETVDTLGFWGNAGNGQQSGYVRMAIYKFNPATLRPTTRKYLSDAFTIAQDTVTKRYAIAANYTLQADTVYALAWHLCPGYPGATRSMGIRYRTKTAAVSTMADTSCGMPASWTSGSTPGLKLSLFAHWSTASCTAPTNDLTWIASDTTNVSRIMVKSTYGTSTLDSICYFCALDSTSADSTFIGCYPDSGTTHTIIKTGLLNNDWYRFWASAWNHLDSDTCSSVDYIDTKTAAVPKRIGVRQ